MPVAEGACICGAVRYVVEASPKHVTICHCHFCQRATGAPYLVEPVFDRANFSLVAGEPRTYSHTSEGSGKAVNINFCGTCGTKLFLDFERNPDVIGVYGGTFDDPNWFDRSPTNTKIIFTDCAQKGVHIPAGYDTYHEHARTKDGTPIEPIVLERDAHVGFSDAPVSVR